MTSASPGGRDLREYGRAGLFGVLTPQGNTTAEPELRILLPAASALLAARLTSAHTALQQRLVDYRQGINHLLDEFDGVAFDSVAFACTGSSYELDADSERRAIADIGARKGYPIVTATAAVEAALATLGVAAIALISPYPAWLTESCRRHWERCGLRITGTLQLPPAPNGAHSIYGLTTPALLAAIGAFDARGADAILVAGTGAPSLRAILALEPALGVPMLSSNLCLAWALARTAGDVGPGAESRLYGGWAGRLPCP